MATKNKKLNSTNTMNDLIVRGKIHSIYWGHSKFSDISKLRIYMVDADIDYEQIHAFDGSGEKLTPRWFKDKDGTLSVSTQYNIKVMFNCDHPENVDYVMDSDEVLQYVDLVGSDACIKLKQVDGALYPVAIKIYEIGEGFNPFEDM